MTSLVLLTLSSLIYLTLQDSIPQDLPASLEVTKTDSFTQQATYQKALHPPEPPAIYKPSLPPCRAGYVIHTFHKNTHHPQKLCVQDIPHCNQYSAVLGDCYECKLWFKIGLDEKVMHYERRGKNICVPHWEQIVCMAIVL